MTDLPQTTPTRDEAVPAGWKLVPVQPTLEMQKAYFDEIDRNMSRVETDCTFGRFDNHRVAYAKMLASAPAPASGGVDAVAVKDALRVFFWSSRPDMLENATKAVLASLSPAATPVSEADMRAFGASELSAYKWPDDTPEHRAARAAFCEGAALAKPASSPAGGDVNDAWRELCERDDRTSPEEYPDMCLITRDELDAFYQGWLVNWRKQLAALSQSTSAGRVGE